jgi:IS30 family transposase
MPRLNNNDRNQALGMMRAGISTREVARLFNSHQSTIVRLRKRFQTTNIVSDRPRPGQPRVTTDQQYRNIRLQHLRNRFKTAVSAARETPRRHSPRISWQQCVADCMNMAYLQDDHSEDHCLHRDIANNA